jgi:hypothetical protein
VYSSEPRPLGFKEFKLKRVGIVADGWKKESESRSPTSSMGNCRTPSNVPPTPILGVQGAEFEIRIVGRPSGPDYAGVRHRKLQYAQELASNLCWVLRFTET